MRIKIEHTNDLLTRRTGLVLVNEFGKRVELSKKIDGAFGRPGSNRGKKASEYIGTVIEMLIDGALHLEDVRLFEHDAAYQQLAEKTSYPTSDAIGDWLRRHGDEPGEERVWEVIAQVLTLNTDQDLTLDIDTTTIQAEKGDATFNYESVRGYQPLLGITSENGFIVGSQFRYGHESPQAGLAEFVQTCQKNYPEHIKRIRSDSAGYNHQLINYCVQTNLQFTITADQNDAVKNALSKINKKAWKRGKNEDGSDAKWEVAETIYTMEKTIEAFRLVVKRTPRGTQLDLFTDFDYWIVATNIPKEQLDANRVILFHNKRGEMERLIGEFKHHFNMDHLPCGQFSANSLYFTIGVLAYNIVQLIKQVALGKEWMKKSIRTLRYRLFHLAGRLIHHARYLIVRIACPAEDFERFIIAHAKLRFAPLVPT